MRVTSDPGNEYARRRHSPQDIEGAGPAGMRPTFQAQDLFNTPPTGLTYLVGAEVKRATPGLLK